MISLDLPVWVSKIVLMSSRLFKQQHPQSNSAASALRRGGSVGQVHQLFSDNRPEAAMQMKMAETANNSPQVRKIAQLQSMADAATVQRVVLTRSKFQAYLEQANGLVKLGRNPDQIAQHLKLQEVDDFDIGRILDDLSVHYGYAVGGDDEEDAVVDDSNHPGGGGSDEHTVSSEEADTYLEPSGKEYIAQLKSIDATSYTLQLKRAGNKQSAEKTFATDNSGTYTKVSYTTDAKGGIDFTSPTTQTAWSNPVDGSTLVDLSQDVKGSDYGMMKSGKLVDIRKASRPQHFSIANRIKGYDESGSPDGWTWHHLFNYPNMVLVDREVHQKYGHNGGVFLW